MIIDTTLLDDVSNGDRAFKLMLIEMIKSEVQESVPQMISALKEEEIARVHSLSHKLKTTLGYIANPEMQKLNAFIEHASKNQEENPQIKENLEQMNNLLPKYIQDIENLASKL